MATNANLEIKHTSNSTNSLGSMNSMNSMNSLIYDDMTSRKLSLSGDKSLYEIPMYLGFAAGFFSIAAKSSKRDKQV